ncbi:MAG: hypothetical protein QOF89_485 [Acidobacteriota bacterium]|jgi:hypothetical protein|nr:hypothetical protein [Acidobacteriota bacterium]
MTIAELAPVRDSDFVRRDSQKDLQNGTEVGQVDPLIAALDLSQVRRKLMEPAPEGKGWSQELALLAEKWYRRYLHIVLKHADVRPVPNHQIDDFWHQHILDTRAYARDCQSVFGRFIHHNPYFGLNGDADERDACFDQTNALYRLEFGEDCLSLSPQAEDCTAPCQTAACSGGGTCKSCTVDG